MREADMHQNGIHIRMDGDMNLARSCGCGQAFRWQPCADGSFFGVVRGRGVWAACREGVLAITPANSEDTAMWQDYFDLSRDYAGLECTLAQDPRLCCCLPCARGIHVFNQEPFETLISFIISANNNIKRIQGIIERLCALAGERRMAAQREYFTFPTPEKLAELSEHQLAQIGAGYRAPYIKASAAMIAQGYRLENLMQMPTAQARKELLCFPGVGPKVADCVLLFSLRHADAFPVDVWIGRAVKELFFDGKQPGKKELAALVDNLGENSGIVQQYVFQYIRERDRKTKRELL